MAKKKKVYARRRSGLGGRHMTKGFFPVAGLVAAALLGAGAAAAQETLLPQKVPYQSLIAGYAVGGVAGAAGAYVKNMLAGGAVGGNGSGTLGYTY